MTSVRRPSVDLWVDVLRTALILLVLSYRTHLERHQDTGTSSPGDMLFRAPIQSSRFLCARSRHCRNLPRFHICSMPNALLTDQPDSGPTSINHPSYSHAFHNSNKRIMSFSNTDTAGKPADPYKEKNLTEPDLKIKVQDLVTFIESSKFGMMTTRIASSGLLVSRAMALAAKVHTSDGSQDV